MKRINQGPENYLFQLPNANCWGSSRASSSDAQQAKASFQSMTSGLIAVIKKDLSENISMHWLIEAVIVMWSYGWGSAKS